MLNWIRTRWRLFRKRLSNPFFALLIAFLFVTPGLFARGYQELHQDGLLHNINSVLFFFTGIMEAGLAVLVFLVRRQNRIEREAQKHKENMEA